jgi:hypothetical protein
MMTLDEASKLAISVVLQFAMGIGIFYAIVLIRYGNYGAYPVEAIAFAVLFVCLGINAFVVFLQIIVIVKFIIEKEKINVYKKYKQEFENMIKNE